MPIDDHDPNVSAAAEQRLDALLARMPERDPPPGLRSVILDALPPPHAAPHSAARPTALHILLDTILSPFTFAARRMEEGAMQKKSLLIGLSAVAVIAIIGGSVFGFPPSSGEPGTIGGGEIGGVQQASRYRGRSMSASDVTVANPEIAVLFQNQDVLTLVKSDLFREVMKDDAMRQALSSDAFRLLMANDAARVALNNDAFRQVMNSDALRLALSQDAFRQALALDAAREALNSDAFREALNNDAFRNLMASDAARLVMNNDAFRLVMANDAFRQVLNNDAARLALSQDAFRQVMANDAFRQVLNNDAFRQVSRNAALSEVFMNEAMRFQK